MNITRTWWTNFQNREPQHIFTFFWRTLNSHHNNTSLFTEANPNRSRSWKRKQVRTRHKA